MGADGDRPLFRPEVVGRRESLGPCLPASPPVTWAAVAVGLVLLTALIAAAVTPFAVDYRAAGRLDFDSPPRQVLLADAGAIRAIRVGEGQRVKRGDVLMIVAPLAGPATDAKTTEQLLHEVGLQERLVATTRSLTQTDLGAERRRIAAEIDAIDAQLRLLPETAARARARAALARQDLSRAQQLMATGYVSKTEVARLQSTVLEREGDIEVVGRDAIDLKRRRTLLEVARQEAESSAQRQQVASRVTLSDLRGRLAGLQGQQASRVLAGIDGSVLSIFVHPGDNVAEGQSVLALVPADTRIVGRAVMPSDTAAFLRVGSPIKLRINSLAYARYGDVDARVRRLVPLPRDPQTDQENVEVEVALPEMRSYARNARLSTLHGLTFTAIVPKEQVSVLELLFRPLLRLQELEAPRDKDA